MTVPLKSIVRLPVDSVGREQYMTIFYGSTKVVLSPMQEYVRKGCYVKTRELVQWKYLPVLVSYSCNISESMQMS